MPADVAALGRRIKLLREALTYSIGKASKRAGITSAYWHAIENATPSGSTGRASIPSVPVLRSIADALDADRVELLELAGYDEDAAFDRVRTARQAGTSEDGGLYLAAYNDGFRHLSERDQRVVLRQIEEMLTEEE